jgi:ABC-type antimicrobial peptide transport system ATPase subunit
MVAVQQLLFYQSVSDRLDTGISYVYVTVEMGNIKQVFNFTVKL